MFVTDKFVFLELYKTGCSHVRQLLKLFLPDQVVSQGKHNRLPPELDDSKRVVIGSIRDPWAWYVSLWAFGCDGKGALENRLTSRTLRGHHHSVVPARLTAMQRLKVARSELFKSVKTWQEVYSDSGNPVLFRQWLKMILDPEYKYSLGDGYGFSPISDFSGIYTHYYMTLFARDLKSFYFGEFLDYQMLFSYVEDNLVLDCVIRNESLELDLIKVLKDLNYEIPDSCLEKSRNLKKTNTSSRRQNIAYYYDDETLKMVGQSEKLIIDKYHYQPPDLIY